MIRYSLICPGDHRFESWFQSSDAFDRLKAADRIVCTVCGSSDVSKELMAPAVATRDADGSSALTRPRGEIEQALAALRREVEENSEYVGMNFASEARAIHDGDSPSRAIYGEARVGEARRLLEDGIAVAPLPFVPKVRTN